MKYLIIPNIKDKLLSHMLKVQGDEVIGELFPRDSLTDIVIESCGVNKDGALRIMEAVTSNGNTLKHICITGTRTRGLWAFHGHESTCVGNPHNLVMARNVFGQSLVRDENPDQVDKDCSYLKTVYLGDDTFSRLYTRIDWLTALETVNVSNTLISSDGLVALGLACGSRLQRLELRTCNALDDSTMLALAGFTKLELLDISGCESITDFGLLSLTRMKLSHMKHLKVTGLNVCDAAVNAVAVALDARMYRGYLLTDVDLTHRREEMSLAKTESMYHHVSRAQEDVIDLTLARITNALCPSDGNGFKLELRGLFIDDIALKVIIEQVRALRCLVTEVDLGNTYITEAGIRYLQRFTDLKILRLDGCRNIQSKQVACDNLLGVLLRMPKLRVLDISYTVLGGRSIPKKGSFNLEEFYADSCNLSANGLARLRKMTGNTLKVLSVGHSPYFDKRFLAEVVRFHKLEVGNFPGTLKLNSTIGDLKCSPKFLQSIECLNFSGNPNLDHNFGGTFKAICKHPSFHIHMARMLEQINTSPTFVAGDQDSGGIVTAGDPPESAGLFASRSLTSTGSQSESFAKYSGSAPRRKKEKTSSLREKTARRNSSQKRDSFKDIQGMFLEQRSRPAKRSESMGVESLSSRKNRVTSTKTVEVEERQTRVNGRGTLRGTIFLDESDRQSSTQKLKGMLFGSRGSMESNSPSRSRSGGRTKGHKWFGRSSRSNSSSNVLAAEEVSKKLDLDGEPLDCPLSCIAWSSFDEVIISDSRSQLNIQASRIELEELCANFTGTVQPSNSLVEAYAPTINMSNSGIEYPPSVAIKGNPSHEQIKPNSFIMTSYSPDVEVPVTAAIEFQSYTATTSMHPHISPSTKDSFYAASPSLATKSAPNAYSAIGSSPYKEDSMYSASSYTSTSSTKPVSDAYTASATDSTDTMTYSSSLNLESCSSKIEDIADEEVIGKLENLKNLLEKSGRTCCYLTCK